MRPIEYRTCGTNAQNRGDELIRIVTRHIPILSCFNKDFKRAANVRVEPVYALNIRIRQFEYSRRKDQPI